MSVPTLPIELIFVIGTFLLPPPGSWSYSDGSRDRIGSLLALSSACRQYRWELTPILWKEVTIFDESHLQKLLYNIRRYYVLRTGVLRRPFTFIRSLRIYDCLSLDRLDDLLRDQDPKQIESLSWFLKYDHEHSGDCHLAFTHTNCYCSRLWRHLEPSLRQVELGFFPDKEFDKVLLAGNLQSLRYLSHKADSHASDMWYEILRAEEERNESSWYPPSCLKRVSILPRSVVRFQLPSRRAARNYMEHSIFEEIEMNPIGPTVELSQALTDYSSTLRRLTLKFDPRRPMFFREFDMFFTNLSVPNHKGAVFPVLRSINIDPLPQQNTAPSFFTFIEACQALQEINGRKVGTFPPCLGLFSPDTPSGALPY